MPKDSAVQEDPIVQDAITSRDAFSWTEFEHRCQKPDHRRIGNWMARRISRPLALRVTRVLVPYGVSAHAMTFIALGVATAAVACFTCGTMVSWLVGAALLQLWYLLDHVDGQLARYANKESLDGAGLDYLMHHLVNLLLPLGMGWGLFRQSGVSWWMLVGVAASVGLLSIGLIHDVRYKAFIKRLKRVRGELVVRGGGAARPTPQPAMPRQWNRMILRYARKMCEIHVVMNVLTVIALAAMTLADVKFMGGKAMLATIAVLSLALAAFDVLRGLRNEAAEREFAQWYGPQEGTTLAFENGWWRVVRYDDNPNSHSAVTSS
ncbi:MAG: CDP-alcohol phosphatidyltransferase family protein [Pirellulales bacterium]|nr:CDP-alcohol phosphatidyltransferase family protein [Pirellulales bacterium]